MVTEVVVKGLGSFGAITGFRQALSGVDGIDSVALSLGQTGEFVFRATHAAGFDVRAAIASARGRGREDRGPTRGRPPRHARPRSLGTSQPAPATAHDGRSRVGSTPRSAIDREEYPSTGRTREARHG